MRRWPSLAPGPRAGRHTEHDGDGDVIPVVERPSGRFPSKGASAGELTISTKRIRRHLPDERDDEVLLVAMAQEVAEVHLVSRTTCPQIIKDLHARPGNWLKVVAKDMAKITERDWKEYASS